VDSSADAESYRANYDTIVEDIAESVAGLSLPEEPPVPEHPPPLESEARVNITATAQGDVSIIFNGSQVYGAARCANVLSIRMLKRGDLDVTVNGQTFHNWRPLEPAEPEETPPPAATFPKNQTQIMASVFGGEKDNEYSSYGPYDDDGMGPYLDDESFYVALPANIADAEMRERGVIVRNCETGATARGPVMDKGPWMVDDEDYVFGDAEAISVTCYKNKTPLPRGPNAGMVPLNEAAIDLSPALAAAIGIDGLGRVDWMLAEEEEA
jgi:hypothetical protein